VNERVDRRSKSATRASCGRYAVAATESTQRSTPTMDPYALVYEVEKDLLFMFGGETFYCRLGKIFDLLDFFVKFVSTSLSVFSQFFAL
jgi:hypothetical protein